MPGAQAASWLVVKGSSTIPLAAAAMGHVVSCKGKAKCDVFGQPSWRQAERWWDAILRDFKVT